MAHYKRHRPRTGPSTGGNSRGHWLRHWPRWHDIVYHTRPARRKQQELIAQLRHGRDPDGIVWPVNHKPHVYYW